MATKTSWQDPTAWIEIEIVIVINKLNTKELIIGRVLRTLRNKVEKEMIGKRGGGQIKVKEESIKRANQFAVVSLTACAILAEDF